MMIFSNLVTKYLTTLHPKILQREYTKQRKIRPSSCLFSTADFWLGLAMLEQWHSQVTNDTWALYAFFFFLLFFANLKSEVVLTHDFGIRAHSTEY